MLDVDPVQLHMAGGALSTAADDAAKGLEASSGRDCGSGFPGTSAAAYLALVEAWEGQDRALIAGVRRAAERLHRSAGDYVAADDDNAAALRPQSQVTSAPSASTSGPLNL